MDEFDAVVIGAGQAGVPLAGALAGAGWRVALVEREHVGGTCVNVGCTPTKTMVASARVAHLAGRAADYGVQTGGVGVDLETVRRRKRDLVRSFRSGSERRLEEREGLELIRGHARFTGPTTLGVDGADGRRELRAPRIFVNVGQRPRRPELEGLDEVPWLTNAGVMELAEVPERLVVLGGGTLGVEFGQMFRRFGSEVVIVQRGDRLLAREDPDVCGAVAELLREDGIELIFDAHAHRARLDGDGVALELRTPDGERRVRGSHLLVAVGRTPNTDDLGAEAAGLELDERGYVRVDERLRTSNEHVWALGDVTGGPAFTHVSYDDFRVVREGLLGDGEATTAGRLVPYTVFIDPQLGRIGATETQAREAGRSVGVAKLPMDRVARAVETDETRGFMKAVVDRDSGEILGAAVLGIEGGEIASILQVAMMGGLPYRALRDGVFSHPTLAESLNNLFATLDD